MASCRRLLGFEDNLIDVLTHLLCSSLSSIGLRALGVKPPSMFMPLYSKLRQIDSFVVSAAFFLLRDCVGACYTTYAWCNSNFHASSIATVELLSSSRDSGRCPPQVEFWGISKTLLLMYVGSHFGEFSTEISITILLIHLICLCTAKSVLNMVIILLFYLILLAINFKFFLLEALN